MFSALVAGAVFNFVATETINYPISVPGPLVRRRPRMVAEVTRGMRIGAFVIIVIVIAGFVFTAPLTYGTPGLDADAVNRRRILSTWTLHWSVCRVLPDCALRITDFSPTLQK